MSALDVIPIPGHPGMYARRVFVEAWQAAGSPPLNSAGRLYGEQKELYDGWVNRLPGFNPADNPDDESQRLAHVRFVAGDIDPTPDRVRRLEAAGLTRPYSYEPWHWELPNVRRYAIVRSIPNPPTKSEEDDMRHITVSDNIDGNNVGGVALINPSWTPASKNPEPYLIIRFDEPDYQVRANRWAEVWGNARPVQRQSFLDAIDAIKKTT